MKDASAVKFLRETAENLKKFARGKKAVEKSIKDFHNEIKKSKEFKENFNKVLEDLMKQAKKAADQQKKKPVPKQRR